MTTQTGPLVRCVAVLTALLTVLAFNAPLLAPPPGGNGNGNGNGGGGGGGGGGDGAPASPEIAFADVNGIYVMDADGGNSTRVLRTKRNTARSPSWSPDGSRLAFAGALDQGVGIYTVNLDGSGLELVTPSPSGDLYTLPDWSPAPTVDGNEYIAFYTDFPENAYNLFVATIDGSVVTQLTGATAGEFYPTWSHDATRLAFVRDFNRVMIGDLGVDETGALAIIGETVVYVGAAAEIVMFPRWSNDGQRIVFSRLDFDGTTNVDVAVVDVAAGTATTVTSFPPDERWASFSPDDTKIAYHQGGSGGGIYAINVDGTSPTLLSSKGFDPHWRRASTLPAAASPPDTDCPGDLNRDGRIDQEDVLVALGQGDDDAVDAIIDVLLTWGDCR